MSIDNFLAALEPQSKQEILYYLWQKCRCPEQIADVKKFWQMLIRGSGNKEDFKKFRVKVRCLRSVLILLKPLCQENVVRGWQDVLKQVADEAAVVREWDVGLKVCQRINLYSLECAPNNVTTLELLLEKERVKAVAAFQQKGQKQDLDFDFSISNFSDTALTGVSSASVALARKFLQLRITNWCQKICTTILPEDNNMQQLHKIRVKIKRLRYSMEVALGEQDQDVVEILKNMQSDLGILHDSSENLRMLRLMLADYPANETLRYEGAVFIGWERAKIDEKLKALPESWLNMVAFLNNWQNCFNVSE